MADFLQAIEPLIEAEGGYKLIKVKGDTGGQTYAGISRNNWPKWSGWSAIDGGTYPTNSQVHDFYKANFWDKVTGDEIENQDIAFAIFSFAVNGGDATARKLAQVAAKVTPDGIFVKETLEAINGMEHELFDLRFYLTKTARYVGICNKNRSQDKFLKGWLNRCLTEVAL